MQTIDAQMNDSLEWTSARVFLAVARTGSLTAAARRLGLSQPTVSRHLQALEETLGARLLIRHARGVRLTDRARELVAAAEEVERAMDGFARLAAGVRETIAGTVRLAASEIVGVEVLAPRLGELRDRHPGVEVELVLGNTPSDLSRGDAALAVRLYRPQETALITKLIGSVQLGFFASRGYLERRGRPSSLAALLEHELIGFDSRGPMARLFEAVDPRLTAERFTLRTDSLTAQLAAARAGCGIVATQVPIAARYPELIAIELAETAPAAPFWLTTHLDLRQATHLRAVWDWCEQVLRDYLE
jgi:molybdate transport repressor ModE-like protein